MDAMEPGKGQVTVTIIMEKKEVLIWMKDNGTGISKESAARRNMMKKRILLNIVALVCKSLALFSKGADCGTMKLTI
jgi:hypothetical protein